MLLPRRPLALVCMLALGVSSTAAAVNCGDTLTVDTSLTADLVCTGVPHALRIATPGVTLKLNGHTIVTDAGGVLLEHANDAAVRGPGGIIGGGCAGATGNHGTAITAFYSDRAQISGVSVRDIPFAIQLAGTRDALVSGNRIRNVEFGLYAHEAGIYGRPVSGNRIVRNTIASRGCGITGVWLDGAMSRASIVAGNRIENMFDGVLLSSRENVVEANTIVGRGAPGGTPLGLGIRIAATDDNLLVSNSIQNVAVGVSVSTLNWYFGTGSGAGDTYGNRIEGNLIDALIYAVQLGEPSPAFVAKGNRVGLNRILGGTADLVFEANAHANDGRRNTHRNLTQPVIDLGSGNLWP